MCVSDFPIKKGPLFEKVKQKSYVPVCGTIYFNFSERVYAGDQKNKQV